MISILIVLCSSMMIYLCLLLIKNQITLKYPPKKITKVFLTKPSFGYQLKQGTNNVLLKYDVTVEENSIICSITKKNHFTLGGYSYSYIVANPFHTLSIGEKTTVYVHLAPYDKHTFIISEQANGYYYKWITIDCYATSSIINNKICYSYHEPLIFLINSNDNETEEKIYNLYRYLQQSF